MSRAWLVASDRRVRAGPMTGIASGPTLVDGPLQYTNSPAAAVSLDGQSGNIPQSAGQPDHGTMPGAESRGTDTSASSSFNLGARDNQRRKGSCCELCSVCHGLERDRVVSQPDLATVPGRAECGTGPHKMQSVTATHTASRRGGSTRAADALRRETVPHRNPLDLM